MDLIELLRKFSYIDFGIPYVTVKLIVGLKSTWMICRSFLDSGLAICKNWVSKVKHTFTRHYIILVGVECRFSNMVLSTPQKSLDYYEGY